MDRRWALFSLCVVLFLGTEINRRGKKGAFLFGLNIVLCKIWSGYAGFVPLEAENTTNHKQTRARFGYWPQCIDRTLVCARKSSLQQVLFKFFFFAWESCSVCKRRAENRKPERAFVIAITVQFSCQHPLEYACEINPFHLLKLQLIFV